MDGFRVDGETMSQRYKLEENINSSKNTRLDVGKEFARGRFSRDEMAHVSRYLFIGEKIIDIAKELKRPLKILDIGCGETWLARVINFSFHVLKEEIIKKYVGIDIDGVALSKAEKWEISSFDRELFKGDVTQGFLNNIENNSFDVVVCLEMIEHIKPKFVPELLSNIKRILSHCAFISTPNFDGGTGQIPQDHIKEWCYGELNSEIKKAGFEVINEIGIFSNMNKVKEVMAHDLVIRNVYNYLKDKMDSNFLSIVMAKFMKNKSQNILRIVR